MKTVVCPRLLSWYFLLFSIIVNITLWLIDSQILNPIFGVQPVREQSNTGILGTLYSFAILIPSFALAMRRLHDIGKSG